jgi:hypothetical protein
MDIQQVEKLVEIAHRVKGKGDTWTLLANNQVYSSLTEVLNAYYVLSLVNVKPQAFRLEPMNGVCYIITTEEIEILKPEPKKYDLYGDFE